jgi:diketogulonate reductase-like aldo/keto reductase
MTLAELALRFVLDAGAVALPRLHRREHLVETMLATAAPPLPRDLTENLDI